MPEKKTRTVSSKSGAEKREAPKRAGSTTKPASAGSYSTQTAKKK